MRNFIDFFSGLKVGQSNMPRSKTSDDIPDMESTGLSPPTLVARTQSVGNLAANSQNSHPIPAPRKDSLEGKDKEGEPKPRPAPRRNVQSCFLGPDSSIAPPLTVPRPLSSAGRGELPPLPKCQPESSQNYYSSVVDTSTIDPKMASALLNGASSCSTMSYEKLDPEQSSDPNVYEAIWTPAVPKRRDVSDDTASSLLDKPLSPQAVKADPFDTSSVKPLLPNSVPPMKTSTVTEERNGQSPVNTPDLNLPSVPPRPKPDCQVLAEFDALRDFGGETFQAPPSSPPPSPPTISPPGHPPLPPPRADFSLCNNDLETGIASNTELQGPPVAVRKNIGGEPAIAPPPVPARPPVSFDTEQANQQAMFMETPPIPARPAPPPPVPKRPAT